MEGASARGWWLADVVPRLSLCENLGVSETGKKRAAEAVRDPQQPAVKHARISRLQEASAQAPKRQGASDCGTGELGP